jgi:hypothetical protein
LVITKYCVQYDEADLDSVINIDNGLVTTYSRTFAAGNEGKTYRFSVAAENSIGIVQESRVNYASFHLGLVPKFKSSRNLQKGPALLKMTFFTLYETLVYNTRLEVVNLCHEKMLICYV